MLHPLLNALIFETQSHGLMYSSIVFKYVNLILQKEKYMYILGELAYI